MEMVGRAERNRKTGRQTEICGVGWGWRQTGTNTQAEKQREGVPHKGGSGEKVGGIDRETDCQAETEREGGGGESHRLGVGRDRNRRTGRKEETSDTWQRGEGEKILLPIV